MSRRSSTLLLLSYTSTSSCRTVSWVPAAGIVWARVGAVSAGLSIRNQTGYRVAGASGRSAAAVQGRSFSSTMSVWVGTGEQKKAPVEPRPSSSVVLLSSKNQILLLHRIRSASSFPSAHVFPGGNVDTAQDGTLPASPSFARHQDALPYRLAAIREVFEESGVLLAKTSSGGLLSLPDAERNAARKDIHSGKVKFVDWLRSKGATPDVDGLSAFTRFVTPTSVPKRFSTQMYIYFLPLEGEEHGQGKGQDGMAEKLTEGDSKEMIPVPTSDGGVEHTAAQFLWPGQWLAQARQNEIIAYPPQIYLLSLVEGFFPQGEFGRDELESQRQKCRAFLETSEPVWADKVMSPDMVSFDKANKKSILGIYKPGPELEGSGRCGDSERVILVRNTKEGPRDVEVRWKAEIMKGLRKKASM